MSATVDFESRTVTNREEPNEFDIDRFVKISFEAMRIRTNDRKSINFKPWVLFL